MSKISFFLLQEQVDRLTELGNVNVRTANQQAAAMVIQALDRSGTKANTATSIIQLLPADGWHALIGLIDTERYKSAGQIVFRFTTLIPLIAWALIERGDKRSVTGVIIDENDFDVIPLCGSRDGLIGYYQSMPDKETIREGLEFLQEMYDEREQAKDVGELT